MLPCVTSSSACLPLHPTAIPTQYSLLLCCPCLPRALLSPPRPQPRMLRRLLERPCTLALLVGSQLAVMMYLSLGGFRSLSALFGREQGPTFDYSHPHDVYSNLSHLSGVPAVAPGGPLAPQGLPYCPERSPFLGECRKKVKGRPRAFGGQEWHLEQEVDVIGKWAEVEMEWTWIWSLDWALGLSQSFLLPTLIQASSCHRLGSASFVDEP